MLDTSGQGSYAGLLALAEKCDLMAFGIKLLDAENALKYLGQDAALIRSNILELDKTGIVPYYFRIPLVPGVTDTEDNFRNLYKFIQQLKNLQYVEFLPYNQASGAKYAALGLPDTAGQWVNCPARAVPEYIKNVVRVIEH